MKQSQLKSRTPRDIDKKKKVRCEFLGKCKRPATLVGWVYSYGRRIKNFSHPKKIYKPMCAQHFMEAFFGVYGLECKQCKKTLQKQYANRLHEDDFTTYVGSGVYFGDGVWCSRHRKVNPICCANCGSVLRKIKEYTYPNRHCECGRDEDSISPKAYWGELTDEERESLCMSHGWKCH